MKTGITLLTMGQGNVLALKKTLESFKGVCDEVVYGDLLIFESDREVVKSYQKEYNTRVVELPFNYIFKNGFSACLNTLASLATNDIVMYMNTSETIQTDNGILEIIKNNPDCNMFYFDHETDKHRWFRCYNRKEMYWSGVIHEEVIGDARPYHKPIFRMADMEKDLDDPFKAKVFDDVKEIVYFNQYLKLVDEPDKSGATNQGWVDFARDNYESMKYRLEKKGERYRAFIEDDFELFMNDINTNPEFENEKTKL